MFLKDSIETRQMAHEIEHINSIAMSVLQLLMPANDFLSTGNISEKEKFIKLKNNTMEILDIPDQVITQNQEIYKTLNENIQKIDNLSNEIFNIEQTGSPKGARLMYEMDSIGNKTVTLIREYNKKQHEQLNVLYETSRHNVVIVNIATIISMIFLIILGFIMIYYFNENLRKPIEKLNRGFQGVSHGRWNHVSLNQNDELSDLAKEFNTMVERMSSSYEGLENEVRTRTAELTELNKRLEALAITDGLTGVYNHRYFYERYHQEYNRALRYNRHMSLFMIDIDHFKHYNDTNGHMAGDKVINRVAKILVKESRKSDIVARYGGEEFVIISPELDEEQALAFAERLREKIEKFKFNNEGAQPNGSITVSIGIAVFPDINKGPEDLLKRTDEAMYQAKRTGRNKSILSKMENEKRVNKVKKKK
ncbi:MAG: diguanylate cyclase [Spirochaetia bacterium]|nr:diguanylate cyclase [Spirochaetia bacterium]